jgi:hypothetical protein
VVPGRDLQVDEAALNDRERLLYRAVSGFDEGATVELP